MRKLFFCSVTSIFCALLSLSFALAAVEGQQIDQSNEINNLTGCMTLSSYNRAQTIQPSLNRILSYEVLLKDRQIGKTISLVVKKESSGETIGTESHILTVGGQGWETFAFEEPFLTVTPETLYGFYITSADDSQTKWCYGGNTYARGQAKGFPDDDFVFVQLGKSVANPTPASSSSSANSSHAVSGNATSSSQSSSAGLAVSSSANQNQTTSSQYFDDNVGADAIDIAKTAETATTSSNATKKLTDKKLWIYLGIGLIVLLGITVFIFLRKKKPLV